MTIIVDQPTTTSWTLTANQICTDALKHMGVLAAGETANGDDMQECLRALDGVLKELPLHGYHWPALSAEVALTWGGTGVQAVTLPTDYYGYPVVWKLVNGARVPITQIPYAIWVTMQDRAVAGTAVTHFTITPAGTLLLWPVVTADPALYLQYQKIVPDAVVGNAPVLPQYWVNPLGYGVANELVLAFGVPQDKRVEIAQRWGAKRDRALENSISSEVISFQVQE